jgi:ATP-dependent Lhr-like helicase
MATTDTSSSNVLRGFHPAVRQWFSGVFDGPTQAQTLAWPQIAQGANTLLLAPTGSGKTLAAFLVAIDRIMFGDPTAQTSPGVRTLYISPLKALGVDVQRNLRSPLAGVRAVAEKETLEHHIPTIGVRSGDTPQADRYRMTREPPEILITTPESLFLMLTSRSREILSTVDTVIIDEIHSLVSSKRGTHLFLSLERLEKLRQQKTSPERPLQRIGLSATQRPLDEIARLLGGGVSSSNPNHPPKPRPVEIIEAGRRKTLELQIEVPVEDMARLSEPIDQTGPAAAAPAVPSIWPSIHPRLVELIRQHRSTMLFVNSRRLAERLAAAINELAEEEIAAAHHGSIARDARLSIEDRLKRGQLPAIVATSSLELGIDMGAVDLVIQIEAPPSIASGIQRIGRSGHQVDAPSKGIIFPKYRGDLLACSAAIERMQDGEVEETYYPRNPLDVLAQQIVAMVASDPVSADELYATARSAAPFFDLPRSAFDGVLDLLSGRYPSDEFAELRPRVTWDRVTGLVSPRKGTQRLAIVNAGTIPDRGLYGVFLASGSAESASRVGELDEEMVFETHPGDVFLLGASSWRVLEITHDRVTVAPAPGEPGRMPFWRGDGPGRPLEFGLAIGQLTRRLLGMPRDDASAQLVEKHCLEPRAATNLLNYLHEQVEATEEAPSDKTIVFESFLDEVGDWRVVVMSPFGSRVHAPWATAVAARLRAETAGEVDMMWTDDGIVFRLPESDAPPPTAWFFPRHDEVEDIVVRELGGTALFAARFRENAARALLLPKRRPGKRTPLWLQRRKSADLLSVASRYERFPIMLETYRECLRDVFDINGLKRILQQVEQRAIRVKDIVTTSPSPFAATLLFNYTANFLYNGDAPLAERRAAILALDHRQLRELLGDAELRELLDADVVDELALELQRLDSKYPINHIDALHELLLMLGDLSADEIAARSAAGADAKAWLAELLSNRRILEIRVAGQQRYVAAEDASRYRDALGVVLPAGLPAAFLESVTDAVGDLVSRFARTHVPFVAQEIAQRLGLGVAPVQEALHRLAAEDRLLEGEFLPGTIERQWCDVHVLRVLKRRSLARLRKQVEPVEPDALCRFAVHWQGLDRPRRGLDGLLDVIEQLQGVPLPARVLEGEVLPARLSNYRPADLDELCAAGEVVWRGWDSLGTSDGRIALYLTEHTPLLAPPADGELVGDPELAILQLLERQGASFFEHIARAVDDFPNDVLQRLWRLVWSGHITNDTLAPLRSLQAGRAADKTRRRRSRSRFRSRRQNRLPGSEGRWSLLIPSGSNEYSITERQTALAAQLIERYGVVTRELVQSERIAGGFSGLYPVFKAMEEAGRVRRGYFVAGLGAAQFAAPGADDLLREKRDTRDAAPEVLVLAATDPANPYGAALPWPDHEEPAARPQRAAGAKVVLRDGRLLAFLNRSGQRLLTYVPDDDPHAAKLNCDLLQALLQEASRANPILLASIDGQPVSESPWAERLLHAGFSPISQGFIHRGVQGTAASH